MSLSDDGRINDQIVEQMYIDLHDNTYHGDDRYTSENFSLYLDVLYSDRLSTKPGSLHDIPGLLSAALAIGSQIDFGEIDTGGYYARFKSWNDPDLCVLSEHLDILFALLIVQQMRFDIAGHLNGDLFTQRH